MSNHINQEKHENVNKKGNRKEKIICFFKGFNKFKFSVFLNVEIYETLNHLILVLTFLYKYLAIFYFVEWPYFPLEVYSQVLWVCDPWL